MGEEAVDTGGPSREFWRLVMLEIEKRFLHGDPGRKCFDKNILALQV